MTFEPAQRWHRHAERTTSLFVLAFGMGLLASNTGADAGVPFFLYKSQQIDIPGDIEPTDMAIGDFNGDFLPDVVLAAKNEPHGFILIPGQPGRKNFGIPSLVTTHASAEDDQGGRGIAVADMNNDGKQDVIFSRADFGVSISPGNGNGTFASPVTVLEAPLVGTLLWPLRLVPADLDDDNDLDLLLIDSRNFGIYVLRNDGELAFTDIQHIGILGTTQMAVGDVDGDGDLDLVHTHANSLIRVRMNDGTGVFGDPLEIVIGPDSPFDVEVVDIDLDGDLDLAIAIEAGNDELVVVINDGTGMNWQVHHIAIPSIVPLDIVLADLDGDQRIDVAMLEAGGTVWLLRNETTIPGQFEFSTPLHVETGSYVSVRIVKANLDSDCDFDLIVLNKELGTVSVVTNVSEQYSQCTVADFTSDGAVQADDLAFLLNEWGKAGSPADLNLSGRVEGMDLAFLLWGWQQPIPQR